MSISARASKGFSAAIACCSASPSSVRAFGMPSSPMSVALPAVLSLPVALPTFAASPSASSRSSAIWNASPRCSPYSRRAPRSRAQPCARIAPASQAQAMRGSRFQALQLAHVRDRALGRLATLLRGEVEHLTFHHPAAPPPSRPWPQARRGRGHRGGFSPERGFRRRASATRRRQGLPSIRHKPCARLAAPGARRRRPS